MCQPAGIKGETFSASMPTSCSREFPLLRNDRPPECSPHAGARARNKAPEPGRHRLPPLKRNARAPRTSQKNHKEKTQPAEKQSIATNRHVRRRSRPRTGTIFPGNPLRHPRADCEAGTERDISPVGPPAGSSPDQRQRHWRPRSTGWCARTAPRSQDRRCF